MISNKQPEIRFPGFHEEWEQRKLGDMAESFEYGLNSSAVKYDGINKYIRITDIADDSREFVKSGLTSPDTDLEKSDDYLLKEGDVLFARTGASVGKSYRYTENDGKVYYAGFLIRGRIKNNFDSEFIFQNTLTSQYNNFIRITSQRSGQPGVNAKEYSRFEIYTPKKEEQQKIGAFFKTLDGTIALHQQELTTLKETKQGFLQKMFPKEGEKVPEIRFPRFTDNWEQCKFKDLTKISQGLQIAISDRYTEPNDNRLFYITNEFLNPKSNVRYYIEDPSKSVIAENDDILMTRTGNTGKVVTNVYGAFHNNFFKIDYHKSQTNKLFLYYLLNTGYVQNEIRLGAGSSTIPDLKHPNFYRIRVTIPSLLEQQKIGRFLKKLDDTIALHQRELNLLKETKKAFLQKMFV